MQFCPWYPLAHAAAHAPAAPGVWQVRLAKGLRDFPGGKSAMVAYGYADDVAAAVAGFSMQYQAQIPLWVCRHLIGNDAIPLPPAAELAAFCAKLVAQFTARFGAEPQP